VNDGSTYKPRPDDWSADEKAALVKLWGNGKTASYISEQLEVWFHTKRTRNAVIGKIHRMQRRGQVDIPKRPNPVQAKKPDVIPKVEAIEPDPIYFGGKEKLVCADVGCSNEPMRGKSYCQYHSSLYHVKPDKNYKPVKWDFR